MSITHDTGLSLSHLSNLVASSFIENGEFLSKLPAAVYLTTTIARQVFVSTFPEVQANSMLRFTTSPWTLIAAQTSRVFTGSMWPEFLVAGVSGLLVTCHSWSVIQKEGASKALKLFYLFNALGAAVLTSQAVPPHVFTLFDPNSNGLAPLVNATTETINSLALIALNTRIYATAAISEAISELPFFAPEIENLGLQAFIEEKSAVPETLDYLRYRFEYCKSRYANFDTPMDDGYGSRDLTTVGYGTLVYGHYVWMKNSAGENIEWQVLTKGELMRLLSRCHELHQDYNEWKWDKGVYFPNKYEIFDRFYTKFQSLSEEEYPLKDTFERWRQTTLELKSPLILTSEGWEELGTSITIKSVVFDAYADKIFQWWQELYQRWSKAVGRLDSLPRWKKYMKWRMQTGALVETHKPSPFSYNVDHFSKIPAYSVEKGYVPHYDTVEKAQSAKERYPSEEEIYDTLKYEYEQWIKFRETIEAEYPFYIRSVFESDLKNEKYHLEKLTFRFPVSWSVYPKDYPGLALMKHWKESFDKWEKAKYEEAHPPEPPQWPKEEIEIEITEPLDAIFSEKELREQLSQANS